MSKYPIPFGRHLLLERINVGGMAEVFKAKSFGVEGFERIVAVKRILPTLLEDDEFTTMFVDEARIASQLTHQNIVQIYDLGRHLETFYISMEYVAGRDLRAILDWQKKQREPMEVGKACFVVSRVCEALEYAHRKKDPAGRDLKIIHRDVTPQNVILSFEGEIKLCDFGIAKAASRVSRTQVGVLKGKFAYMSPEQVRGQPIDRRSDLFALGVIFYEMLTGERLFLGESDYATLEGVRNAIIPPPRQFNPKITPELERVMLNMLARDPRERYQWASEVHEDLLDHLVDQGRPYHSRHLRQWMQGVYAREIEIENAKLESFMELRLPPAGVPDADTRPSPSALLSAPVAEPSRTAPDPAESQDVDFLGDPTDHYPVPEMPQERLSYDDDTEHSDRSGALLSEADSPVSDLFGAPALGLDETVGPEDTGSGGAIVRPAGGLGHARPPSVPEGYEEPQSDGERTQFDMAVDPSLVAESNETLYDDANETVMGDSALEHEISAAQAELLNRLDQAGALDVSDTVDGSETPALGIPELDPADLQVDDESATLHGDETHHGPLAFHEAGPDDTNITPLVSEAEEDAFAATALRAPSVDDGQGFAEDDGGTVEDAPLPTFDPEVFRRSNVPPPPLADTEPNPPADTPPPPVVANPPRWRRAPSVVQGKLTPRPAVERNHPMLASQVSAPPPSPPRVSASEPPVSGFGNPRLVMALAGGVGLLAAVLLVVVVTTMQPKSASLKIVCEPTRVEVELDGAWIGDQTPVEIGGLAVGPHRVVLRAAGYADYEQTIQIREPKPHAMSVQLEAVGDGKIARQVEPGAEEELPMGDAAPEDAGEGMLVISTNLAGVQVRIDGKDTGLTTPIDKPYGLSAGAHVVTFVMDDGRTYDFDVDIRRGQRTTLDKSLR